MGRKYVRCIEMEGKILWKGKSKLEIELVDLGQRFRVQSCSSHRMRETLGPRNAFHYGRRATELMCKDIPSKTQCDSRGACLLLGESGGL